jgi:hypothetical protein
MKDITMVLSLIHSYIESVTKSITNLKSKSKHLEFEHKGITYKLTITKISKGSNNE